MVKQWDCLSFLDQTRLKLEVKLDPVKLAGPYFLNIPDPKGLEEDGLWPMQRKAFRDFYSGPYNRWILTGGMRMSKSFCLSFFLLYETFLWQEIDFRKKYGLLPSSAAFILIAAGKEEQAQENIMTKIKPLLDESPYFKYLGFDPHPDGLPLIINFPKNLYMKIVTSKTSTEVGKTSKAVGIDEAANLEESAGPRGGDEFYKLISKSTKTFKRDGHVFVDGTSKHPGDMAQRLYERFLKNKHALALKYATWEFNPNFTKEDFAEDYEDDAAGAERDFAGSPTAGELVFFKNPDIFLFDQRNVLQQWLDGLKPEPRSAQYVLVGDPSTKKDAFGLGLVYKSNKEYFVDGVIHFQPKGQVEIDPKEVQKLILGICDYFPVRAFVTDVWSYQETLSELKSRGIPVLQHFVKRDEYINLKNYMYQRKVHLPEYGPLKIELSQLIDKGNKVDHPRYGSKDVTDTIANAIWYLDTKQCTVSITAMSMV